MLSLTLRGRHRDTFKIVPPGAENDPGQWIFLPIEADGDSLVSLNPNVYTVYVRPAYTKDWILTDVNIPEDYKYIRETNPTILSDGTIDLSVDGVVLEMEVESTSMVDLLLPYIGKEEVTIRVLLPDPGLITGANIQINLATTADPNTILAIAEVTNTTDLYIEYKLDFLKNQY